MTPAKTFRDIWDDDAEDRQKAPVPKARRPEPKPEPEPAERPAPGETWAEMMRRKWGKS